MLSVQPLHPRHWCQTWCTDRSALLPNQGGLVFLSLPVQLQDIFPFISRNTWPKSIFLVQALHDSSKLVHLCQESQLVYPVRLKQPGRSCQNSQDGLEIHTRKVIDLESTIPTTFSQGKISKASGTAFRAMSALVAHYTLQNLKHFARLSSWM